MLKSSIFLTTIIIYFTMSSNCATKEPSFQPESLQQLFFHHLNEALPELKTRHNDPMSFLELFNEYDQSNVEKHRHAILSAHRETKRNLIAQLDLEISNPEMQYLLAAQSLNLGNEFLLGKNILSYDDFLEPEMLQKTILKQWLSFKPFGVAKLKTSMVKDLKSLEQFPHYLQLTQPSDNAEENFERIFTVFCTDHPLIKEIDEETKLIEANIEKLQQLTESKMNGLQLAFNNFETEVSKAEETIAKFEKKTVLEYISIFSLPIAFATTSGYFPAFAPPPGASFSQFCKCIKTNSVSFFNNTKPYFKDFIITKLLDNGYIKLMEIFGR